ncbi:ataxin-7-like protein 2 [Saccostrea cucullata]|uniref:ataxin-7-like protein 2 n=1 Tax=Saccostrea cuccullata TaxID=36930 RepID=UPI002ED6BF96
MATLDDSPSLFIGKSWSEWAENVPLSPLEEHETVDPTEKDSDDTDSMRLPSEDMHMFGTCPSQDEFYLVMCERCQKVIKPQAFKKHLFERHGITESSASPSREQSYPTSKLSSPNKLTSPTRTNFRMGHSVPTKASVKEVPPLVSSAQKLGLSAKFKGLERSRRNHSMPVVKVERMELKRVSSQQFDSAPKSQTSPSGLANGNSKDSSFELTDVKPVISGVDITAIDKPLKSLSTGSLPQTTVSLNCATVTMATTTLTTASTSCITTTKSVTGTTTMATTQSGSLSSGKGLVGSRGSLSMPSLSSSLTSNGSNSFSSVKKKPIKFEKPEKLIPCKDREYDCNKHCGVFVEDTGKSCTRSLTCKTHALSLRRKVPGRRKPFDDLLKEHREAKELLLKQKAEQKAALQAAAEKKAQQLKSPPVIPPGSSQLAAHLLNPTPLQSYNDQHRERSSHPPQLSPKKTAKPPQKLSSSLQQRSSFSSLHSPLLSPTKEEPIGGPSLDGHERLSDGEGEEEGEKSDSSFIPYQPRPAAMCTFGGRLHTIGGRRSYVFGRKTDILRAAFLNVLEKQLNPPPPKKLCVESNLPKEPQLLGNSKDPYDFTAIDPRTLQKQGPVLNSSHKSGSKSKSKSSNMNRNKSKDSIPGSKSPAQTNSAIPAASAGVPPLKRKRSGGAPTNSSPSSLTAAAAPVLTTVSINNTSSGLTAIAIPSVNLSNATLGHFNANLSAAGGKNAKNNVYKDVGFVVTNLDSALVNGQYMITNAHQSQTLDEKSLQQAHVINSKNSPKILNLETLQGLQKGPHNLISMPPLLLDGSTCMQPVTAVLTPVSLTTTLGNQIVSVGSTTSLAPSNLNSANNIRAGATGSPQVVNSALNGLVQSSSDKLVNNRHNLLHHKKPLHSQSAGHGMLGNTVIATSTGPQVSQIYATHLLKPGNLLIGKPSSKFAVPTGSLTLNVASLGMSGVGQQPTLYIASNEDVSQQQVVSSPSHMT